MSIKGYLVLADGHVFAGELINAPRAPWVGELVFSTAMTGYTEILSDPSFFNQIVILTSAEIGNYGVSVDDFQSNNIMAKALVVRNLSEHSYSWRQNLSLHQWLRDENKCVLTSVDTRALVSHLRSQGAMMAAIGGEHLSVKELYKAAVTAPSMAGQHLSSFVSVSKPEPFLEQGPTSAARYRVLVMDFGVKRGILRALKHHGALITVVPNNLSAEEILALNPDGLCLSNGPGDPRTEIEAVKAVADLIGKLPIFGICLGHQILAQALGLSTYKLKCGHRGSNQPILKIDGRVIMSAQNHGFAVQDEKINMPCDLNLMDRTNEGLDLPYSQVLSVQFHPEGAPGPKDADHYFQMFFDMIEKSRINKLVTEKEKALKSSDSRQCFV